MDSNTSYKRNFIVLDEESDIFRADNQKTSTGYAKIEDRGIKTKVSIYIQDLLPDNYKVYCICVKDGKVEALKCGEIIIDKNKKAEFSCETMSSKIFEKNYLPEDIVGISIISKNNTIVLEGFKGQKLEYKVEDLQEQKQEEQTNEILEEQIEPEQEKELEIEQEQKVEPEPEIEEVEEVEEEVFGNIEDYYIPFEKANIKIKWIKKPHSIIDNDFSRKFFLIPRLYYLCAKYKHYIIGEDENKMVIGIPSNYSSTYIYIKSNFGDSVKWVPISEQVEDYGYWLFFVDKA